MASKNVTLEFNTTPDRQFSTEVSDFDGHTVTLQYENSNGNYIDYTDDAGDVITSTVPIQGTFTAPTTKSRWLVVPGGSNLSINVTPTRTA
jgi:hypothetical protein